MPKWVIDPGHGGKDPGAVGNGLREKDITLFMAKHLYNYVKKTYPSVDIYLTRYQDEFVDLSVRASRANARKADVFLSIHVNAGGGTGFESFIHPNAASRTAQIQEIVHKTAMKAMPKVKDRGMKRKNLAVLRQTTMPAILVETLFIDNAKDAKLLKDEAFLKQAAEAYADCLAAAFKLKPVKVIPSVPRPVNSLGPLHRVIVDGRQVGAFSDQQNVLNQVKSELGKARRIEIERV